MIEASLKHLLNFIAKRDFQVTPKNDLNSFFFVRKALENRYIWHLLNCYIKRR